MGMHGKGGPGMGMHGKGPGGPFEMLMKGDLPEFIKTKLGITPQQIGQIKNLVQGHMARMEQLQLEKKRVMAQLMVEWLQDRLDENKIKGLWARKLKAAQEMMQKKLELKLGIAKVLTAQQRLKILSHHKPGGGCGGK
jgi:Spy/CpxP family protein refolding chaperone